MSSETPAEAGREVADPDTMNSEQAARDGARDPLRVGEAVSGWAEMSVAHVGGTRYIVADWSDIRDGGNAQLYRVDISEGEVDWVRDAPPQIVKAVWQAPEQHRVEENAFWDLVPTIAGLSDGSERPQSGSQPADDGSEGDGTSLDTDAAVDRLTAAFEDHDGLYVKETGTDVYEGTDQVTFSIGGEDFSDVKRVTSECDIVGYNGEMNTLAVGDVEEYIAEVLS